jgi:2'-5' RNA ligase
MRETGLLVEVPEAEPLVGPWRERYDPVATRGVPAHITVLYPFIPPADLDAAAVDRLRGVLAAVKPFSFHLARLDAFPGVVWLRPEPHDPFTALTTALWSAFPGFPPYGGAHPDPQPHLTVGLADSPAAQQELHRHLADAFAGRLPVTCHASSLTVFTSDDSGEWTRRHVLGFEG